MALKSLSSDQSRALLAHLGGGAPGWSAGSTAPTTAKKAASPLDTLLDIVDRPRRAVGSFLTAGIEHGIEHPGDVLGSLSDAIGSGVDGLVGHSAKNSQTTSQDIESVVDTYGKVHDPNYKDTQDNVNPILKGVLGFVGDVATDPLTYVPGLDVIKGAKILVDGARGAEGAVKGVDALKNAGRALLPGTEKMKTAVLGAEKTVSKGPEVADLVNTAAKDADETVTPASDSADVQNLAHPEAPVEMVPEPAAPSALMQSSEQARNILKFLDTAQDEAKSATLLNKATPVDERAVSEAVKEPIKFRAPQKATWAKGLAKLARDLPEDDDVLEAATIKVGKEYLPIAQAMIRAKNSPKVAAAIDDAHQAWIKHASDQAAFGHTVDEAGRVISAGPAVNETRINAQRLAAGTASTTLQRVKQILGTDEGKFFAEQHLGAALTRNFGQYSNPEAFDGMVARLRKLASGDESLDTMSLAPTVDTPEANLLAHTGINAPEINVARREWATMKDGAAPGSTIGVNDSVEQLQALKKQHSNARTKIAGQFDSELAAEAGVRKLIGEHMEIDLAQYKHATADGVARATSATEGAGLARRGNRIDSHAQFTLVKTIRGEVQKVMERRGYVKQTVQTQRKLRQQLETVAQRLGYDAIDSRAVPVAMTFRDATGVEAKASLTHDEVNEILSSSPVGADLISFLRFGKGSTVNDIGWAEGIARLVRGDSIDDVLTTMAAKTDRYGKDRPNWSPGDSAKVFAQIRPMAQKTVSEADIARPAWTTTVRSGKNINVVASPDDAYQMLGALLEGNRAALQKVSQENAAKFLHKVTDDSITMTKAELSNLNALLNGDNLARYIVGLRGMTATTAKLGYSAHAATASAKLAAAAVDEAIPDGALGGSSRAFRAAEQAARDPEKLADTVDRNFLEATEEGRKWDADNEGALVDDPYVSDAVNISDPWTKRTNDAFRDIAHSAFSALDPARQLIDSSYAVRGKVDIWKLTHEAQQLQHSLTQRMMDLVNAASRSHGALVDGEHSALQAGFQAWQRGAITNNPAIDAASADVKHIMDTLINPGEGVLGSPLLQTTSRFDYINRVLSRYSGLQGKVFDIERGQQEAIRAKISLPEAMARQITEWHIEDPAAFMVDFQRATMKVVSDGAVASAFVKKATELGLVGKGKRVIATGDSAFAPFLPSGLTVDGEAAYALQRMEHVMKQSRSFGQDGVGGLISNVYDPAMQAWKRTATVLNPGHHLRNYFGDALMTYAAEGMAHSRRAMVDSFKVLQAGKSYDGVDLMQALNSLGETALDNGATLSSGKFGSLSAADLFAAAKSKGILYDTKQIETLEDTAGRNGFQKILAAGSFAGDRNPVGKAVNFLSEARDHQQLMQHFLQIVYKAQDKGYVDMGFRGRIKPKDVNHLFELATDKVIKAHPNATLLTAFERKYMTRIIPFYTWMRGAMPFIVASSVRYPGRALAVPRASFGLATAMGVNPQSLSDPFPAADENKFPNFLTDEITGPQFRLPGGSYFAISPGAPQLDVANFLATPGRSVLGMLGPVGSILGAAATGTNIGTGAKINDASDFVDSQIPYTQTLSNLTGISPTGSILSALTGQGLDSQLQVAKGNKASGIADALGASNPNAGTAVPQGKTPEVDSNLLALLNKLTGVGATNDSNPSYAKIAQQEQQDAKKVTRF